MHACIKNAERNNECKVYGWLLSKAGLRQSVTAHGYGEIKQKKTGRKRNII